MTMRRTLAVAAVGWSLAGAVLPVHAELRVGIRDTHLAGIGAESVWSAAKEVTTPFLEVVVTKDLACPKLFEGKQTPYRVDTPQNRKKLLAAAEKNGCEIVAFCAVVSFVKDESDDGSVAWIEKVTKAAADMKVPVIMMPLGSKGIDQPEFAVRAITFLKRVAPFARASKVQLTVENLGPYLNKREVLKPLMEAVPDDEVGLALDITNMYWFGYPPAKIYELAQTFATHVRYAHAKNIKYPPAEREKQRTPGWQYGKYAERIRTGDLDFDRILGYLFKAGFKGDVVIEDASLGKHDAEGKKKVLKDDAALLRELIAKHTKPATAFPRVKFETSLGDFVVELYPDKTPVTVENFLRYVDDGFYDGTIFHRIMANFMIQGGGFVGIGQKKTSGLREPIRNEASQGLKNERGTISMAQMPGNQHSATSGFFINVKDNPGLDPNPRSAGYCAFGRVVEGMDVVDEIKNVAVRQNPIMPSENSAPADPPVVHTVRRVK